MKTIEVPEMKVETRLIDELKPFERNARTHSKHQVKQIVESMRSFGITNPILIDGGDRIIAGHGRVQAAIALGMKELPTIRLDRLSEDQIRAYVIADNKIAENAGWDKEILAIELQHLMTIEDLDLDVTITGFEIAEIDVILNGVADQKEQSETMEEKLAERAVSRPGDLWQLGKHKLLCGNSLQEAGYRELFGKRQAAMVFTDPPYNVPINQYAAGFGATQYREFQMAAGEMSETEFISFLGSIFRILADYSKEGSVHQICMDWRHIQSLFTAAKPIYSELLNLCVWAKDRGGQGSFYRSQHELVLVFRKGRGPHCNNIQLGQYGRYRTNVWKYPSVNGLTKSGEDAELAAHHPTIKPVQMVADAIQDCSARGEIVLDPFCGSGTTLIASERVGRICYSIEIDPLYVDLSIRRWQNHTGLKAILSSTGKTFDEAANENEVQHV